MIRKRPDSGLRAAALAAALFAITLNFFQPLVHAALMRDGAPSALWGVFCSASVADPDASTGKDSKPATVDAHECCLGLAHATPLMAPPTAFINIELAVSTVAPLPLVERPSPVGIRDGPAQPRGPPSLV